MNDFIEIEILNWAKYNPRTDAKKPSWFRFENALVEDDRFFGFTGDEFKALVYLLSKASQRCTGSITVSPAHADRVCRIDPVTLATTIEKLHDIQFLRSSARDSHGHRTASARASQESMRGSPATNVRTYVTERNETDERTINPAPAVEPVSVPKPTGTHSKSETGKLRGEVETLARNLV